MFIIPSMCFMNPIFDLLCNVCLFIRFGRVKLKFIVLLTRILASVTQREVVFRVLLPVVA
jgi:hypothetical protein